MPFVCFCLLSFFAFYGLEILERHGPVKACVEDVQRSWGAESVGARDGQRCYCSSTIAQGEGGGRDICGVLRGEREKE